MGGATTQALGAVKAILGETSGVDLDVADELFAAARLLGRSSHLRGALGDWAAPAAAREKAVSDVFGASLGPVALALLTSVAVQRWSSDADLVDAVEETAIRAASVAGGSADIEGELFGVSRAVADNPELELALGRRAGDDSTKGVLVSRVLGGTVSDATLSIATSLVQQLRGRRIRPLLARAERVVADQRGRTVATVIASAPLSDAQSERLRAALSSRYGEAITLNTVIDASVVGGLRVQIADDVIDASVATRLSDLRLRLAG